MKLFFDLDDVIVDFSGGYKLSTGVDIKDSRDTWRENIKDIEHFWLNLPSCSYLDEFKDFIVKNIPFNKRYVLSAAPSKLGEDYHKETKHQKIEWLKRNCDIFPEENIHIVQRKNKKLYAKDAVLVDDFIKNIEEWTDAGGTGVHHIDIDKTIQLLSKIINV